jgi:glycosyl transferase family 11
MIITRLTGGIGNQMFQYAFGRRLADHHKTELKLDLGFYSDPVLNVPPRTFDLDIFNITSEVASDKEIKKFAKRVNHDLTDRVLNRIFGVKASHIREPHFYFSEAAFNSPDNVYLSGYWQSEKYFGDIEPKLRRDFTFKDPINDLAKPILEKINCTESVCVHVRRGDFLTNPLNGLYGKDYYVAASEIVSSGKPDKAYFVFSDDVEWCKENLQFDGETTFVDNDFGPRKFRDDLWLMSECKHFIIANSSFSWWAVWLNTNPRRTVVAPKAWFQDRSLDTRDLIPDNWVTI